MLRSRAPITSGTADPSHQALSGEPVSDTACSPVPCLAVIRDPRRGKLPRMLFLLLLLAALVVLGIVLAVTVIKWLFILAIVAALCWVILFFFRRIA